MTHTLRSATAHGAMQRAVQSAHRAEEEGLPGVTVFAGFASSDTLAPCLGVVAMADGAITPAVRCVERIARCLGEPLARAVVECDGRGVTSSDYGLFPFGHVKRPVYPFDPDTRWPC